MSKVTMAISTAWDEAFQALHVIIQTGENESITLTSGQALDLWRWLQDNHAALYQADIKKREHREWLEK